MTALTALAPILTPICGVIGVLGGAWLVYRQNRRQTDTTARTATESTQVAAMKTVTDAFTAVLTEQRAHQEKTAERVSLLESKVSALEEEQRTAHRWKAAALRYFEALRRVITDLNGTAPEPEDILREDLTD
jgi:uncharacterized coiled-coil protein SlyX